MQGGSRFSWEFLQTFAGAGYSQIRNTIGKVDRVDFFGGATFVTQENAPRSNPRGDGSGISLGNFINIDIPYAIEDRGFDNFDNFVIDTGLYMHEYGHTFDSRLFGLSYLFGIGIPSAAGAEWTEGRANSYAARYFGNNFGVNWGRDFEMQYPR